MNEKTQFEEEEPEERKPKKKNKFSHFLKTLARYKVALCVLGAALIILVLAIGIRNYYSNDQKATKLGFEDVGELATQSAYCTVVNVTDTSRELFGIKIPFTQSKYIYSYDVIITAGYDFTEITCEEKDENTVEVVLPPVKILSEELQLDSFKIYHEAESIFRQISLEENNQAMSQLVKTAEENAIENGLYENARANAQVIMKGFLSSVYDPEVYEYVFKEKDQPKTLTAEKDAETETETETEEEKEETPSEETPSKDESE